ncbi:MAG: bifunctional adenosylcobinamide kinase/adenosylcobinamide-phosphate guanylyltransferase [Clostridiales bacterium]|nr:bifunctional adenosylcobinamide kinase/adenosylcobinamide-phosphate guanylyltransferase [Clostridiales bacterium]
MLILVIGGSGSGKSEYAERRCMELDNGQKLYLATMDADDKESRERIARHRQLRSGKGFDTQQCPTHPEQAALPPGKTVLLECLSNLTANEMFSPAGRGDASQIAAAILSFVRDTTKKQKHLVVVTNQVFSDGISYGSETDRYMRCLAQINVGIAALADEVTEVVHGIPLRIKGKL